MHKLVYSVFKALMMSMIFVFVWDIGFYLYRVAVLNQRMENIMISMQRVVMENNCLPEDDKNMYLALFQGIGSDMNGDVAGNFVSKIAINYDSSSTPVELGGRTDMNVTRIDPVTGGTQQVNILRQYMSAPANYGDIMVVRATVTVHQPIWNFTHGDATPGHENSSVNWQREGYSQPIYLNYTYFVPCLKYQTVTN